MFAFAPLIQFIDWFTTRPDDRDIRKRTPSPLGLAALELLKAEAARGAGEEGGNNRGPDIDRYNGQYTDKYGSWCAKVQHWAVRVASIARGRPCPVKFTAGAKAFFRRTVAAGWLVKYQDIQPGDIACWHRGNPHKPKDKWKGHVGMVSQVIRDQQGVVVGFKYLAGNEGPYPAKVAEHDGTKRGRRMGFARLSG